MMFVLTSRFLRGADALAPVLDEHSDFIARGYEAGRILVSGRQDPWEGGVIVARGEAQAEIEAWIGTDPLVLADLVRYEIQAFQATEFPKRSAGFDHFAEAPLLV